MPKQADRRLDGNSVRGEEEGAAAAAAQHDEELRLRPISGFAQRREARRRDRSVTARRSSTKRFTCSTSGPSRAPTRCGWNASARTCNPRAITAASNRSASASAARASPRWPTKRTTTGARTRACIGDGATPSIVPDEQRSRWNAPRAFGVVEMLCVAQRHATTIAASPITTVKTHETITALKPTHSITRPRSEPIAPLSKIGTISNANP